ncbi:MAG TPA: hypothetical protein VKR06_24460 [Ktedonosporobacter sp.]|nr:hypothetical protein [Ktedonosporobacter sp.]
MQQEQLMGSRLGREQDNQLEQELEEGEQLLWFDRPLPGSRSRQSPLRVLLILTIVFGSVCLLLLLLGLIFFLTLPVHIASFILFGIGGSFAFVSFILGMTSIGVRFGSVGNQLYAITDQRIIIMRKGRNLTVNSYSRDDIGPISRIEHSDGSGDLIFTHETPAYSYNYNYNYSYNSASSSSSSSSGYGGRTGRFIGIRNVHDIERILRRTFKRDSSPKRDYVSQSQTYGDGYTATQKD